MNQFHGKVAVITGAASGFGKAFAAHGAKLGMKLVLADIQQDGLDATASELRAQGATVAALRTDVSVSSQVQALADLAMNTFGEVNLLFNNAGVGAGGLVWENSEKDWEWVLGVNLNSVIHGIRIFTPLMLEAAARDAAYEAHIVNTASMSGLVNAPTMGVYNVSKHAVVSLSETLYHDLALVTDQIHCSVLCPYFVPTGFNQSRRNRPANLANAQTPTRSQQVAQHMSDKAVTSAKISAQEIAQLTYDAVHAADFYIYSHPNAMQPVTSRFDHLIAGRNPGDPYAGRPELRENLARALRG
ncbi:SDR family oxidoreductase [Paraburkholderia sp. J76]|uniref:SDR family oxidoreductase n=1 Tax=Paraburkholderia sp. J76 TaxID=2805439 RepID=UPI002ABE5235|nr:SDR family oxidoreductase [Paraburkholderia sp. J76]